MSKKLSINTRDTIHFGWTTIDHSYALPPTTLLFMSNHFKLLIDRINQCIHWQVHLLVSTCENSSIRFKNS